VSTAPSKHRTRNHASRKFVADLLSLVRAMVLGDIHYGTPVPLSRRLACVPFYFATPTPRRMFAVPPRSGTTWGQLGMELALNLARKGDGAYDFENHRFWPTQGRIGQLLDWRVPLGTMAREFSRASGPLLGEQIFWQARDPYYRIRSARLGEMKIVLFTRSILAVVESAYFKFAAAEDHPEVTLDDQDSFDWDEHLDRSIEFFNSWGDAMTWHPGIRHFKFEDLKRDPVAGFSEIFEFWGLDVPEDCVAEGFRRASKQEMMKRISADEHGRNLRLSTRGTDQRGIIEPKRRRRLSDRLEAELIYDFGYDFGYDADYGVAYE